MAAAALSLTPLSCCPLPPPSALPPLVANWAAKSLTSAPRHSLRTFLCYKLYLILVGCFAFSYSFVDWGIVPIVRCQICRVCSCMQKRYFMHDSVDGLPYRDQKGIVLTDNMAIAELRTNWIDFRSRNAVKPLRVNADSSIPWNLSDLTIEAKRPCLSGHLECRAMQIVSE
jgi:hypothetical protein